MSLEFRVGIGYDLHPMVEGRKLILGGVEIPFERGLAGHSDADIVLHAVTDALLGAAGLGDIGEHFPPSDPRWRDASSLVFLRHARELTERQGYRIVNVDAVIVLERPKILPYRDRMRQEVANALGIEAARIGIKSKTAEGMGPVGEGKAAEAHATALISRPMSPGSE